MSNEQPKKRKKNLISSYFTKSDRGDATASDAPTPSSPVIPPEIQSSGIDSLNNINAIERDPGKRCPIWKYLVNQRDSIRRAYSLLGPMQPECEFPYSQFSDQQRKCQFSWFKDNPWLEYSKAKDRAYCFPCFLFATENPLNKAFTIEGFKNWKRTVPSDNAFLNHVGRITSSHNSAMQKWDALRNPSSQIEPIFSSKSAKDIEDNRLRLIASIESVRYLASQGIAFRGHDESEESLNQGPFRQLIKSFGRVSLDIKRVIENAPRNAKYISPSIQKDILNILGNQVRGMIREEVGAAKYCLLVDEAIDVSNKKQMAIILRFVDSLGKDKLQVRNMRGQGYDGASNMRDIYKGLQALFLKECPYAYYLHCFAHRLQLTLNATAKGVHEIWKFFSILSLIVNFMNSSGKHHSALKAARKEEIADLVACGELETGTGANQIFSMQRAGATRWGSHYRSIRGLIELFGASKITLVYMSEQGPVDLQREAGDVLKAMQKFVFVFCLLLMNKVMKITETLSQTLQQKSLDFVQAMRFVKHTKELVGDLRKDGWTDFFEHVESFCKKHEIKMPDMHASTSHRSSITNEHHYRVDIFNALIDFQLSELDGRFSEQAIDLLSLASTLDPHSNFSKFKTELVLDLARKYYPEDFYDGEMLSLESECAYYEKDMLDDAMFKNLSSICELCPLLVQTRKSEFYPMLYRLICLVLTLPVSTATTERAFSAMNYIKNKLRNKMEGEFLGDCMVLHIEKDYANSISNDFVIKQI
ncbi:uncharacterized protein LOC126796925 [Argentina anserina]|uniref:uncharacterized protein LOC126796925 n=1 Tax=Argentina anserina TaxID=57926 RepID=UPI0021762344|nr:uncharacterized protein LOC126796925 [Potentilla anserina]